MTLSPTIFLYSIFYIQVVTLLSGCMDDYIGKMVGWMESVDHGLIHHIIPRGHKQVAYYRGLH